MKAPFIDIHTHALVSPEVISICNIFIQDVGKETLNREALHSVGLHPWHIAGLVYDQEKLVGELEKAVALPEVIAIGETGLDKVIDVPLPVQQDFFMLHVSLAAENNMPVILHCVRAYQEILRIRKNGNFSNPWIFHNYSGSAELTRQIQQTGCFPSFGAALMNNNKKAVESLKLIGSRGIFLETDSGHYSIDELYIKASGILGISRQMLRSDIYSLYKKIFKVTDEQ